jgi:hypothetical protein
MRKFREKKPTTMVKAFIIKDRKKLTTSQEHKK